MLGRLFFTLDQTMRRGRCTQSLAVVAATALMCMAVSISQPVPAQVPVSVPSQKSYAPDMLFRSPLNSPIVEGAPAFIPGAVQSGRLDQRIDRQDILDLEPAVAQAELILAVRLVDVTETKALALDAPADLQYAAGQALGRLDPPAAVALISSRLASKHAAGLRVALEIDLLGRLPRQIAAPELLKAWNRQLVPQESLAFAGACARMADPRFIPAVSTLLDPRQWQVRAYAVEALGKIDTDEAASALWPHLDEEPDLSRKLKLIAFLGRHGFREGYAQALEHLSQVNLREEAVEAIAAIAEPRAIPELRRIWQTSNDLAWNAAAIRALARLDQADITPKLLALARTPGEPLAPSALIGLGDLGSSEAIPIVRDALSSRSDELVIAATRAAAKLLARPGLSSDQVRDRLASLLADADASPAVRQAALDALAALRDTRLTKALEAAARDANLEGLPLLEQVEHLLATRTVAPGASTNSQ